MKTPLGVLAAALWMGAHCALAGGVESEIRLDFPVLDYPFNGSDGYTIPSMEQSLQLSRDFYHYSHQRINDRYETRPGKQLGLSIGFDVLSLWLPFGSAWLHEEWHRAVMSHRKIDSYNEIYRLKLFDESIAVSKVSDEDLIRLKAEHPADLIRLHAAGIEAQYQLNYALEKDLFFGRRRGFFDTLHWLNYINSIAYLDVCASDESNRITRDFLNNEDPDIGDRDFTGLDCNAWVYDLFRRDEPYTARGIHPSGTGIQRYIQYSDLTDHEKTYLNRQYRLSYLNLVNPLLFRFDLFTSINPFTQQPFHWNAALRHHMTSFGHSVDINLFAQSSHFKATVILHSYYNKDHYFPGLSLSLHDYPVTLHGQHLRLSPRISLWRQPEGQRFDTGKADTGILLATKTACPLSPTLSTYLELEVKTDGWVAGNVYLEDNVSVRFGFLKRL